MSSVNPSISSSGINFTGDKTTVTTTGKYPVVGVDCGHCTGTWDWSSLDATGGEASDIVLGGATVGTLLFDPKSG